MLAPTSRRTATGDPAEDISARAGCSAGIIKIEVER
jgi:hypothetical protein